MASRECTIGMTAFGAKAIDEYLTTLHQQLLGASGEGPVEFIHQSRVYSRRLRAALTIFDGCFQKEHAKLWMRRVKAVTRSLGAARDLDVQILLLGEYMASKDEASKAELDVLLQELIGRRAAVQPDVEEALVKFEDEGLIPGWHALLQSKALPLDERMWQEVRTAALGQVVVRRKELLAFSDCVADEKAVQRHHQMRIAAKWLRYTLETFAPAYDDGLKQYISRLKKLQDILGEMHDCDVWIEALLERLRWRCGPAVAALLQDRQTTRSLLYGQLVTMWREWEGNGLLSALETDLLAAIRPRSKHIDLSGLTPSAKVALIADVHGNLPALEAVMEDAAERGAEVFINAGDSIGWGPFDNEVVQYLRDPSIFTVLGNYDQGILAARMGGGTPNQGGDGLKRKVAAHALHNINDASISFLLGLPEEVRFEMGGKRFLITHASPVSILEPVTESTDPARLETLAKVADADVVVLGHTHRCMDLAVGETRFLNPGSVGRPVGGDPRASYVLLDTQSLLVEFVRVRYDLKEVADRIVAVGLPKKLAQMYLAGRGTDEPEEKVHAQSQLEMDKKLELVEGEARRYGHLDGHSLYVRSTAVQLFDHLQGEHGLGAQERYWLECGALLHDIGWSQSGIDHNLASFNLVMSDHQLPLDERERLIVASLTRYHRKGLPKEDHGNYKVLSKRERRTVDVLAGILRVADGLDVRHAHDVRVVGCWADPHVIIVEVEDPLSHRYEIEAGRKKGKLLEKAFDRRLAIQ